MRNLEHLESVALCNWWAYEANKRKLDQRLLIHIPNEGRRPVWVGRKLKAAGLRPGTPDYFLAISQGPYHGLFVELKTESGRLQDSQLEMLNLLHGHGYKSCVAHGTNSAIETIEAYLDYGK